MSAVFICEFVIIQYFKKVKICNRLKAVYLFLFDIRILSWFINRPTSSFILILISGGFGLALSQPLGEQLHFERSELPGLLTQDRRQFEGWISCLSWC